MYGIGGTCQDSQSRCGFQEGAGNIFRFLNVFVHILIHLAKSSLKLPVKKGTTCPSNLEDSRNENSATAEDAVLVTKWIPENDRTGKSRLLISEDPLGSFLSAHVCTIPHVPHWGSMSSGRSPTSCASPTAQSSVLCLREAYSKKRISWL